MFVQAGLTRNSSFCIGKCRLASEVRAAHFLTPAPGQGLRPDVLGSCGPNTPAAGPSLWLGAVCKTGWGGGRNLASALPHEKQSLPQCEMTPHARNALKSGDPSDQTLAFFEHAAPPSPLQAGAPERVSPGPLRGPLQHQCMPLRTSEAPPSFLREQRAQTGDRRYVSSRLGVSHAGAPAWRGLGGAAWSKNARAWSEGSPDFSPPQAHAAISRCKTLCFSRATRLTQPRSPESR